MRKLILLATFALPLAAQQPQVQNGQLTTDNAPTLQAEIEKLQAANTTTWLAYAVPSASRIEYNANDITYLEDDHRGNHSPAHDKPAPPYRALILLRIGDCTVNTVRIANPDRPIDAGGTRVAFLPTVDSTQSVRLLQSIAEHATGDRLRDSAILALSVHLSPATVPALTELAAPTHDLALREKAAFWLSTQHGAEALPILDRWSREDKDDRFREKLAFDLTLVHQAAAADTLIRMAHQDPALPVRKQAQFWMAQIASQVGGKRVTGDLGDSAVNDPNQEIRKSAVFGLSQLPNGEGTGKLIELARTSRDPAVRKQAVFWLGQSNDPRALEYLTKLIQQ